MMALVATYLCEERLHHRLLTFQRLHETAVLVEQQSRDARLRISPDTALEHFLQRGPIERFAGGAGINNLEQWPHNQNPYSTSSNFLEMEAAFLEPYSTNFNPALPVGLN